VITRWFYRYRGRAMAIATSGITISGATLAPVIGLLIGAVGWRSAWAVMGLSLMVVIVPLVVLFMRRRPEDMGLLPDGDTVESAAAASAGGRKRKTAASEVSWTLKDALRTRTFWVMVLILNTANLSGSILTVHVIPFFTTQEGLSASAAGLILSARFIGSTLGRAMWGFLVERVPMRLCLAGFFTGRALGVLSLILLPFPYNVPGYVLGTGPLGGPMSFMQPMTLSTYYGREYIGSIQGGIRPFLAGSSLAGPLVIALLYDASGSFSVAFGIAGALGLVGALLALAAKPPVKRAAETPATSPGGV
jgi:MFS family permease